MRLRDIAQIVEDCKKCKNFTTVLHIGNEGIALSAAKTTIYQIERRVRREKTYSAMYFVCRAGMAFLVAGIQMDAVISLKLKVIVKSLYDINNGNELPLRDENEQKMGT